MIALSSTQEDHMGRLRSRRIPVDVEAPPSGPVDGALGGDMLLGPVHHGVLAGVHPGLEGLGTQGLAGPHL